MCVCVCVQRRWLTGRRSCSRSCRTTRWWAAPGTWTTPTWSERSCSRLSKRRRPSPNPAPTHPPINPSVHRLDTQPPTRARPRHQIVRSRLQTLQALVYDILSPGGGCRKAMLGVCQHYSLFARSSYPEAGQTPGTGLRHPFSRRRVPESDARSLSTLLTLRSLFVS